LSRCAGYDRAERSAAAPLGVNHEGVAEMEHGLLAKAKLGDRRAIRGLAALAEWPYSALVFLAKGAVISNQKSRSTEKRIGGGWPAMQRIKPKALGCRIVRILQQLLEDRIIRVVPILQVALDLIDSPTTLPLDPARRASLIAVSPKPQPRYRELDGLP
jgi:hypothetical protein